MEHVSGRNGGPRVFVGEVDASQGATKEDNLMHAQGGGEYIRVSARR